MLLQVSLPQPTVFAQRLVLLAAQAQIRKQAISAPYVIEFCHVLVPFRAVSALDV